MYSKIEYNAGEQTGQQSSHFWVVSRRLYLVFVHLVILSLALLLQHNHRERQNLKLHLLPSELRKIKSLWGEQEQLTSCSFC